MVHLRRNLLVSAILAALILVVQLIARNGWPTALLSAAIAFVVALVVLYVADRYSRS